MQSLELPNRAKPAFKNKTHWLFPKSVHLAGESVEKKVFLSEIPEAKISFVAAFKNQKKMKKNNEALRDETGLRSDFPNAGVLGCFKLIISGSAAQRSNQAWHCLLRPMPLHGTSLANHVEDTSSQTAETIERRRLILFNEACD